VFFLFQHDSLIIIIIIIIIFCIVLCFILCCILLCIVFCIALYSKLCFVFCIVLYCTLYCSWCWYSVTLIIDIRGVVQDAPSCNIRGAVCNILHGVGCRWGSLKVLLHLIHVLLISFLLLFTRMSHHFQRYLIGLRDNFCPLRLPTRTRATSVLVCCLCACVCLCVCVLICLSLGVMSAWVCVGLMCLSLCVCPLSRVEYKTIIRCPTRLLPCSFLFVCFV